MDGRDNTDPAVIAEVLRDRNALFRTVGEQTENGYTLKVINKTDKPQAYTLTLEADTAGIVLPGMPVAIKAAPQEVVSQAVTLSAPASVHGRHDVRFVITGADGARLASRLPVATLKRVFAAILYMLAAYMLWKGLTA